MSLVKVCGSCKLEKPRSDYNMHARRADGLQWKCRACQNERDRGLYSESEVRRKKVYQRNRRQASVNKEYVREWLRVHHCVDCAEDNPIVLDFDHVRGRKRGAVADMARGAFSLAAIAAEIAKCDVRCANCHRKVTFQRRLARSLTGKTRGSDPLDFSSSLDGPANDHLSW